MVVDTTINSKRGVTLKEGDGVEGVDENDMEKERDNGVGVEAVSSDEEEEEEVGGTVHVPHRPDGGVVPPIGESHHSSKQYVIPSFFNSIEYH